MSKERLIAMELLGNRYIKICEENIMCFKNYIFICREVAEKEIKRNNEKKVNAGSGKPSSVKPINN